MSDDDLDDELRTITEQIQIGDTEEGARALAKVIQRARGDNTSVRRQLAEIEIERQNDQALKRFQDDYPDLAADSDLAETGASVVKREIIEDLKGLGFKDEDIAPARGDLKSLAAAHAHARLNGFKVRTPDQILDATGEHLSKKYNIKRARSPGHSPAEIMRQRVVEHRRARGLGVDDVAPAGRSTPPTRQQTAAPAAGRPASGVFRAQPPSAYGDADEAAREEARRAKTLEHIQTSRVARGYPRTDGR
jgi:hypothetical protein